MTLDAGWKRAAVLFWFAATLALTVKPFLWHITYFRDTGIAYRFIQIFPAVLLIGALVFLRLRRNSFWRVEPLLFLFPLLVVFLREPLGSFAVLWTLAAAYSLGRIVTKSLNLEPRDAPVAVQAGLGLLILIFTALGKAGLWYRPIMASLLLVLTIPVVFFWKDAVRTFKIAWTSWREDQTMSGPWPGLTVGFAMLFTCCSVLVALTPVIAWDVLSYHFPLAQHYLETHRLHPTFAIPESFYPQGNEVLQALEFALGGEPAAQLLVLPQFALFLWLAFRIARECGASRGAALLGAGVTGFLPFLHWTSGVPKNDLAMSGFQIASLYAFLRLQRDQHWGWLALGAFFLGQSFGVKHVALLGAIPLTILFSWFTLRRKDSFRKLALFGCIVAISGLFWMAETYWRTGNPAFPQEVARSMVGGVQAHSSGPWSVARRYADLPRVLLFDGRRAFESVTANPLAIFLLLFAPLPFLMRRAAWTPPQLACVFFTIFYLAHWSSLMVILRYCIVPITLIVMWMADALYRGWESAQGKMRAVLITAGLYSMVFSLFGVVLLEVNLVQIPYLLGRISTREYLEKCLNTTPPLFRIADIEPHAAVYGVNACARFYAPDPLTFGCVLCEQEDCWAKGARTSLETRKFKYVVLKRDASTAFFATELRDRFAATLVDQGPVFDTFQLPAAVSPIAAP